MIHTFLSVLLYTATVPHMSEDIDLAYRAYQICPKVGNAVPVDTLLTMLQIERAYGVPDSMRGMTLAAACMESGFNPNAKGDHHFGHHYSRGLYQQHAWYETKYGIDRKDPIEATISWLDHVVSRVPKAKRCGYRNERDIWVAAWVIAIRAPSHNRCREKPKHLYYLAKFQNSESL